MAGQEHASRTRPRLRTAWLSLLALVGLVDSAYLTWDHGVHFANPTGYAGGLCGVDGGCAISRTSALSEIPLPGTPVDLPIAVLGLAFYAVFVALLGRRSQDDERDASRGRVLFGLASLSVIYSLVLLGYSLSKQSLCPFCAVLYGVNLGLLALTWSARGSSFAHFVKDGPGLLVSNHARLAALLMVVVTALGYLGYRGIVSASTAEARERMATAKAPTVTGRPTKGAASARFQFTELADFQCPHCKIAYHELEEFAANRSDVAITFLHFPLDQACNRLVTQPFHAQSCERALFAECAHRQGLFFDAAPLLFDSGPLDLDDVAEKLAKVAGAKLDAPALNACRASPEALGALKGDIEKGIEAGVQGTPTIFLNGMKIGGSLPKAELEKLLAEISKRPQ